MSVSAAHLPGMSVRVVRGYDGAAVRDGPGYKGLADRPGQVDHKQVFWVGDGATISWVPAVSA